MTVSPDLHRVRIAEGQRLRFAVVDLEHGDVRVGVGADQPRRLAPPVAELHLDLVHALDDVVVRDDVPFLAHDGPGAELILHASRAAAARSRWKNCRTGRSGSRASARPCEVVMLTTEGTTACASAMRWRLMAARTFTSLRSMRGPSARVYFSGLVTVDRLAIEKIAQQLPPSLKRTSLPPFLPQLQRRHRQMQSSDHEEQEVEEAFHGRKMMSTMMRHGGRPSLYQRIDRERSRRTSGRGNCRIHTIASRLLPPAEVLRCNLHDIDSS